MQTKIALGGVSEQELQNIVIAYEPVWAIGTGKTATADQAEEVCAIIRGVVEKLYHKAAADAMTIQYGGSMKPGNAAGEGRRRRRPDRRRGAEGAGFCRNRRSCKISASTPLRPQPQSGPAGS